MYFPHKPERIPFTIEVRQRPEWVGESLFSVKSRAIALARRENLGILAPSSYADPILRHPRSFAGKKLEMLHTYFFLGDDLLIDSPDGLGMIEAARHIHVDYDGLKQKRDGEVYIDLINPDRRLWSHTHPLEDGFREKDWVVFAKPKPRKS